MQANGEDVSTPKTPRKRTPVKKQASVWFEPPSKQLHTDLDMEALLVKLQEVVNSLTKRLNSLETEWAEILEHLSGQEDFTDCITEEEEMN